MGIGTADVRGWLNGERGGGGERKRDFGGREKKVGRTRKVIG